MGNNDQGAQPIHSDLSVECTHDKDRVDIGSHDLTSITSVTGSSDELGPSLQPNGRLPNECPVANGEKGFRNIVDSKRTIFSFETCHTSVDPNHSTENRTNGHGQSCFLASKFIKAKRFKNAQRCVPLDSICRCIGRTLPVQHEGAPKWLLLW